MATPVPASTARDWVIASAPLSRKKIESFGRRQPLLPAEPGVRLPGDVPHGQVAPLDEAVEERRLSAVEPGRCRRVVRPGLDRRLARRGGDVVIGLARRTVEHVRRAAVGTPAAVAGLAELAIRLGRP